MKIIKLILVLIGFLLLGISCNIPSITHYYYQDDTITKIVGSENTQIYFGFISKKDIPYSVSDSNSFLNIHYVEGEFLGRLIFRTKGHIEYLEGGLGIYQQKWNVSYNPLNYKLYTVPNYNQREYFNILDSINSGKLPSVFLSNIENIESEVNSKKPFNKVKICKD